MNTTVPDFLKTSCRHCGGHIEFPQDHENEWHECPHCHVDTKLEVFRPRPALPPIAVSAPAPAAWPPPNIPRNFMFCPNCGTLGKPRTENAGSAIIELFLYLFFLIPGLFYSCWRVANRRTFCRTCGHMGMIPPNSPRAQQMMRL